jgi:diguanylate cyclase (GGDEF)-like protein
MRNSTRPTIGVLFGFHIYEGARPAPFSFPIIRGMQAAAKDKGVNLMLACGVARRAGLSQQTPAWPELSSETDFLPVGPWNTDGLIFTTPMLTERKLRYARRLADDGFPALFIGRDSGSPALFVDNEGGIRQEMEHLVGHGHRSIAFIAGYEQDTGDSFSRLDSYRKGVREFELADDPRLVEYGQHWDVGGFEAMRRVLHSGVGFTAVMCSNDHSAMGAVRALREAGLRVSRDVAVAGFDDVPESVAQVPPLTSVHYPLFETGYRAVLMLQKRIEQGPGALPDVTRVSTWVVPRQSCGCLPETVAKSALDGNSPRSPAATSPEELARSMLDELLSQDPVSSGEVILPLCERLAGGFLRSLEGGDCDHFLSSLSGLVQQVETDNNDSAYLWQSAISVLRRAANESPDGRDVPRIRRAEDLLHQARTLLSESIYRRYTRLSVEQTNRDEQMGLLTARLISSTDENQVYRALREDLQRVGVRSCNIVFFGPRGEDPMADSVLHPLEEGAPAVQFETRNFPPAGVYPEDEPFNLALLPLSFQEEKMGYAAFDGANLDPLATLVRQMASSIKNARLHATVMELSLTDGLTNVHNRRYFEIMLQKEAERSKRYKRNVAVIMLDIDRFKRYNDTFGHPAGDDALKVIARCLEQGARRGLDIVTRYGGEEFAVILPETDIAGAMVVAENIRRGIEENRALRQPTTVSLGIASVSGEMILPQALVDNADRALYQAKVQGRNRTVVFERWMEQAENPNSK